MDSPIRVPASDLDGVNVFTLLNISASVPGMAVTFDIYKLPDSLNVRRARPALPARPAPQGACARPSRVQYNNDKTLSLLYLFYEKGYDCVISVRARAMHRPAAQQAPVHLLPQ